MALNLVGRAQNWTVSLIWETLLDDWKHAASLKSFKENRKR